MISLTIYSNISFFIKGSKGIFLELNEQKHLKFHNLNLGKITQENDLGLFPTWCMFHFAESKTSMSQF